MNDLEQLVDNFAAQLSGLIEAQALDLARSTVAAALGGEKPGRPPSLALGNAKPRKKMPIQLCPVPGCKNKAAPVFGMVCAEHKDLPKAKIKKYREARRAAKLGKSARPAPAKTKRKRRAIARKSPKGAKRTAKKAAPKKTAPKKPVPKRKPAKKRVQKAAAAKPATPPAPAAPPAPATAA